MSAVSGAMTPETADKGDREPRGQEPTSHRAVSSHPVIYAERPGAHHDFDMFESIRSAAVSEAVEQFTARVG